MREDLGGSHESEKVPIFSPENGPNEVSPICLKMVRIGRERPEMYGTESTKCTFVAVFYYDTIKLTKKDYFYPFCTKSMEQCSKKVLFFSPENGPNEVSPISS